MWTFRSDRRCEIPESRCAEEMNPQAKGESVFLHTGRRDFLKLLGAVAITAAAPGEVYALSARGTAATPVKNRSPLVANSFYALPLGAVKPQGWLARQLRIQANGLSGHLDETWADVGPNSGWLGGTGESWERGPYFLDGLVPLAYQLDDARLKAKAQKYIDWTLSSQQASGMFGPRSNDDWWPRMVMLKVLTQYEEATGDPRVIPLMSRYFNYQLAALPTRPLRDWGKFRWQDEVLSVVWLYNRTGDPNLLKLAHLLHDQGYDWQAEIADFHYKQRITPEFIKLNSGGGLSDVALATHGVNNGMAVKTGPVWAMFSGAAADRDAAAEMLRVLDRYHGLPNGMFSCDEHLAGLNPSQGSELCTVVELMFSLEQSLAISGDALLGDRLEKVAFNALPGTFTDDMWAHQYNQEPNQVECSLHREPWTTDGPESNLFGLDPNFGCCAANFHQGWPKFAASLWMASHDDGLAAVAYAPSSVEAMLGETPVRITETTDYPFRNRVQISIDAARPTAFPLRLRIPAWSEGTSIRVNGKSVTAQAGSFTNIARTWKAGDQVEIDFAMKPRVTRWFQNSVAIDRGSLVFSLPVKEDWLKLRDRGMTADWQVYPASEWNYALNVDEKSAPSLNVVEAAVVESPFTVANPPVKLEVMGRKLPSWVAEDGVAKPVPAGPIVSSAAEEKLTLVPYAAAKLRITAFPQLKT